MKMVAERQLRKRKRKIKEALAAESKRCAYCGRFFRALAKLTLDHVIPKSKGGSNKRANLVLACGPCNQKKGNADPALFRRQLRRSKRYA